MKKIIFFLALGCALAVSCKKENGEWGRHGNSAIIGVNVSGINGPATKADAVGEQLFDSFVIDTIGGQEIWIDAYVSDYNPEVCGEETKGTITTTTSIMEFKMSSYAQGQWYDNTIPEGEKGSKTNPNDAGKYFEKYKVSRPSTSSSEWSIGNAPNWLNDVELTFWSWYTGVYSATGETPVPVNGTDNKATISITNNGSDDLIYAFNREKRVFDDKTGEITGGSGTYNIGYKDKMDIKLYHALSAIRFDISGLKNNGLTIKEISIEDVTNSATCTIEGADDRTVSFDWDNHDGKASFTREFDASTDFTETSVDGTTSDALMPMTSGKFFFLIPQEVQGKGIKVKIKYSVGTATETTTSEVTLDHEEDWEPGKYYTYRLNAGAVNLALTGTSPVVNLKNTGSTKVFIRAAIVANWCMKDTASNIWYPLSECPYSTTSGISYTINTTTDDTITGGGGHWELKSDGFWYYTKAIDPNTEIPLLTAYTINGSPAHAADSELRLTVIGQAVKAGNATNWAGAATVSN